MSSDCEMLDIAASRYGLRRTTQTRLKILPQLYERVRTMIDSRMENAMRLADTCWAKAMAVSPDFVRAYLEVADTYLSDKAFIRGSELRRACSRAGVQLPDGLHHNTWVSAVRALSLMGWIQKHGDAKPVERHNHMNSVTVWRVVR